MKRVIVIPARYGSTRLPGKPLLDIGGKPLLQWVYERALEATRSDEVLIATDDGRIEERATGFGAQVVMTDPGCPSGTDRVLDALKGRAADIVVNLQGDEPFVRGDMIDTLIAGLEGGTAEMASLCCPVADEHEYRDPHTVKVVMDQQGMALYFSRSPVPFLQGSTSVPIYKHIGIYAFTRPFLERFAALPKGRLEQAESLEQLRALEGGYKIMMFPVQYEGIGIDTEEDLERARALVASPENR